MKNDGHDTTVSYSGNWTRSFVTPLLINPVFMNKTLLIITFDENENYSFKNNVLTLLLGDIIPDDLRGTTDNSFYTHYSLVSTIQNNWGLYSLGRGDVLTDGSANVFQLVANATGYKNVDVAIADIPYYNFTASGYFDTKNKGPIPAVNQTALGAGEKGILPSLKGINGSAISPTPSTGGMSGQGRAGLSGAVIGGIVAGTIGGFILLVIGICLIITRKPNRSSPKTLARLSRSSRATAAAPEDNTGYNPSRPGCRRPT